MNKIFSVIFILTIFLITGCKNKEENPFAGSGTIEAREITISSEAQGKLIKLAFEEGDYLHKGQLIAEVDVEKIELQKGIVSADLAELDWSEKILKKEIDVAEELVSQASISLDNVQKTRDRISNLYKQNAATKEKLDKTETELALSISKLHTAEKQLAEIKTHVGSLQAKREKIEANFLLLDRQIKDGKIVCPSDGAVIEKYMEQGEIVNFGTPICMIADISTVWIKIYAEEEMLGKLILGSKAFIGVDSHPDTLFEGRITWISPRAEFTPKNVQTKDSRADLVYAVKITVKNSEGIFKIGMPADVYIEGL